MTKLPGTLSRSDLDALGKQLQDAFPAEERAFAARALMALSGPTVRMAFIMRLANLAYYGVIFAILAWLFGQAIDRNPPVEVISTQLLTPRIRAGDAVKIRYHVRRSRVCEVNVSYLIFDGLGEVRRFGPQHADAAGNIGVDDYMKIWSTPTNLAPGASRLRVIWSHECPGNYLQAIYPVVTVHQDINFEVLPSEGQ